MRFPALVAVIATTLLTPAVEAKTKPSNATRSTQGTSKPLPQPQPGTFEARIDGLVRQAGYEYRRVQSNSWYLIVPGKEMAQIRIILGAGPNTIAMGAVVVPKKNLPVTSDAMYKMMKLSYDLNYVRVCIDADDDLIVMSQMRDQWLTADEFKNTITTVAAAADRAYGIIRPFIITP